MLIEAFGRIIHNLPLLKLQDKVLKVAINMIRQQKSAWKQLR